MEMTKALARPDLSNLPFKVGSEEHYIQAISRLPTLSAEEEHRLACRYRDHNDLEAARGLVPSHVRFVVHIARGYTGYGLPLTDLIQEGNIGLMKAVKRFDPEVGVRLVSFAVHWIRAEIHEFILRNWRIVKIATTKAQRKLFFNLRGSKKRLGWLNREEVDAVANDLGVKPETVQEMESRLSGQEVSFDPGLQENGEDDDAVRSPAAYLKDSNLNPAEEIESRDWQTYQTESLATALAHLDERSCDIVRRRWLNERKATLQELADHYQVSAERIRQLEKNALKKLRSAMSRSI